jgi:hypothetical protein
MSVLPNESFSHNRDVEAALPFSAIAQRFLLGGKYEETHNEKVHINVTCAYYDL